MVATMLDFGFQYGHLLWKYKMKVAQSVYSGIDFPVKIEVDNKIETISQEEWFVRTVDSFVYMKQSQAYIELNSLYDSVANRSSYLTLLDCKYCMTMRISVFVQAFVFLFSLACNFSIQNIFIFMLITLFNVCMSFLITSKA